MFRLWAKVFKDNRLIRDMVSESENYEISRTKRIFDAIEESCKAFDIANPIWLDAQIKDFKAHSKVKFGKESFVEEIDFDFLEIQVIEE